MVNDISCRYRIQLVVEAAAGGIGLISAQSFRSCLSRRLYTHDEVNVVNCFGETVTKSLKLQLFITYEPVVTEITLDHCELIFTAGDLIVVFGNAGDSHKEDLLSLVLGLNLFGILL